jgi:predicted lipid-binding transport protein (Tim44 family)
MIDEIRKYDDDFTEATFLTKADHIFIMILSAIMENDLSSVKHYLSEDVYNHFDELVKSYEKDKVIRLFDEMNVKSTDIIDAYKNDNGINIVVKLVSRYMDYFINEDGEFASGINDHRIELSHNIVFTKNLNAKELDEVRRCPTCGHSLDINSSGLCSFCGNTIDMSEYDYIVTEIDNI